MSVTRSSVARLIGILVITGILSAINGQDGVTLKPFLGRVPPEAKSYDKLVAKLLDKYEIRSRPYRNLKDNVTVQLGLEVVHLTEMDEKRGIMTLETWILESWEDVHLTWDPEENDQITVIRIPNSEIWKPDITVYTGRSESIVPQSDVLALVYSNGQVLWIPPVTLHVICEFDYTLYPKDAQKCSVTLGSWTHDGVLMDIVLKEHKSNSSQYNIKHPMWHLEGITSDRKITYYECCSEPYMAVHFNLTFSRKDGGGEVSGKGPRVVSALLILFMFCLPERGHKILLGCSSLLIQTLAIFMITLTVPVFAALPYALSAVQSLLTLSLLAFALELVLGSLRTCTLNSPPRFVISLLDCRPVQLICCLWVSEGEGSKVGEWCLIADFLDRIALVIFSLLFFACKTLP